MKELTAAQGLLRCGECDTIFDAMKALSTTLPEERTLVDSDYYSSNEGLSGKPRDTRIRVLSGNKNQHAREGRSDNKLTSILTPKTKPSKSRKLLWLSLAALAVLLLLQLLYTSRAWLISHPLTSKMTQNVCTLIGCEIETPRDVTKIRVLSRSVYSHPNSPKLLIISSSMQNDAVFALPYPFLEISFLNKASEVVALRRFTPKEYVGEKRSEHMMEPGVAEEFSVNIADPGQDAVNFQFRFL